MPTVQHIALNCRDRRAQEGFYSKHFGFRRARVFKAGEPDEFVLIRRGAICMELFQAAGDVGDAGGARGGEQRVGFKHLAFADAANQGMLEASQSPEPRGTDDVVKTTPYYPIELLTTKQVRLTAEEGSPTYNEALTVAQRATSDAGYHYCGNAKSFLLTGDAMARGLANLMAGGEPSIHAEVNAGDSP